MNSHLTGTVLYNAIQLRRRGNGRRVLVVEGEQDYELLYEHFAEAHITLMPGVGKAASLEAAEIAAEEADDIRFYVDADFDRILGTDAAWGVNVVASDRYDLVADVSELNPRILRKMARKSAAAEYQGQADKHVEIAREIALVLGSARYASRTQGWELSLGEFPTQCGLPNSLAEPVDVTALVTMALTRTTDCALTLDEVRVEAAQHRSTLPDQSVLINGHDLLNAMAHVSSRFGAAKSRITYTELFGFVTSEADLKIVPAVSALEEWVFAA